MGEPVPVSIGRSPGRTDPEEIQSPGAALGHGAAGMLRHLVAVLDREDRLESGSGEWLARFGADLAAAGSAVEQSVLRALHLASDPTNFAILSAITASGGRRPGDLSERTGLNELSVAERVSDLVSAGLASKLPGANQVVGTGAAEALVGLVTDAVQAGVRELGAGR